jgi:hypothetical protein
VVGFSCIAAVLVGALAAAGRADDRLAAMPHERPGSAPSPAEPGCSSVPTGQSPTGRSGDTSLGGSAAEKDPPLKLLP